MGVFRRLSAADARRAGRYNAPAPGWVRYSWLATVLFMGAALLVTVDTWWLLLAVPIGIAWVIFGGIVLGWQRRNQARRWRG